MKQLRAPLEAVGIDVWFDQRRLEGGDDFDQPIKKNIRSCSLFVPVISANTQARHEGFFRLEWTLAAERSKLIAETIPLILPVVIDPVSENDALVPSVFSKCNGRASQAATRRRSSSSEWSGSSAITANESGASSERPSNVQHSTLNAQ